MFGPPATRQTQLSPIASLGCRATLTGFKPSRHGRSRERKGSASDPQFGLVAEQVEKIDPQLAAYDEQGKPYSVRYEAVNAMLLNEFLKEHRKDEEQEAKSCASAAAN